MEEEGDDAIFSTINLTKMASENEEKTKEQDTLARLSEWTCLHEAAKQGNVEFLKTMRDFAGIDLAASMTASSRWTLLHIAAFHGRIEVVDFLLGKKTGERVPDDNTEQTNDFSEKTKEHTSHLTKERGSHVAEKRLDVATGRQKERIMENKTAEQTFNARKSQVKSGNLNARNDHGRTPLHVAASIDCYGGDDDYSIRDSDMDEEKMARICASLIDSGADVDAVDIFGATPLHVAVRRTSSSTSESAIVKRLLENGANTAVRNKHNQTPLAIAVSEGKTVTTKVRGGESRTQRVEADGGAQTRGNNSCHPVYSKILIPRINSLRCSYPLASLTGQKKLIGFVI